MNIAASLIALFLLIPNWCTLDQEPELSFSYKVSGVIKGGIDGDTLLLWSKLSNNPINTAVVKNSKFEFTGRIDEYLSCRISYRKSWDIASGYGFILEEEPVFIQASVDSVDSTVAHGKIVHSGKQNRYVSEIRRSLLPILIEMNATFEKTQKARQAGSQEEYQRYLDENKKIQVRELSEKMRFYTKHTDAFWSLHDMYVNMEEKRIGKEETLEILNSFDERIKAHSLWKKIKERVEVSGLTEIGANFRSFEANSLEGKAFSVAKYSNKYFLLDFWASWCGPCRVQHPNLKKVYEKYKSKDFTIVSVSLDDSEVAWQKAVLKDQLVWDQFSDLKKPSPIAEKYGITVIPANFLISPSGEIIDKDLTPEELEDRLEQILK